MTFSKIINSKNKFAPSKVFYFFSYLGSFLRFSKIQTRLITAFLVLSLLPLTVTGVVSYRNSSKAIQDKIEKSTNQLMIQLSQNLQVDLNRLNIAGYDVSLNQDVQNGLIGFSAKDPLAQNVILNSINDYIKKLFNDNKDVIVACIYVDENTYFGFGNERVIEDDMNTVIKNAADKSKINGIVPYYYFQHDFNRNFIAVVRQIKSITTGQIIGSFIILESVDHLNKMIKDVDIGTNANMFIINSEGLVISSKTTSEIGNTHKSKQLIDSIKKNTDTPSWVTQIPAYGSEHLIAASRIDKSFDWFVVGAIPFSYLNKESNGILVDIVIVALIFLILSVLLSYIIAKSIAVPLKDLVQYMKEARSGNLAINVDDKNRDELGNVSSNFNDMLYNIRGLVSKVNESAQIVLKNSNKISIASEQSYLSSEQISLTIQEIARGASDQASEVALGTEYMRNLSEGINKVGNDMLAVLDFVENTKHLSETALLAVKSLNDKALETNSVSHKIVNDINVLNNDMKEIKKIVKVIVGFAKQTKLLSLNAAIEAARAGESGKGFAVVADDVKKLSDKSKDASIMINDIITTIQQKTEITVNAADSASMIVKQQMDAVSETDSAFKTILNAMQSISSGMDNMGNSVNEMLELKNKTLGVIENVSAIAQESAATVEEVSASTEEQMSGAEELSIFAKDLNLMAKDLTTAISIFKT